MKNSVVLFLLLIIFLSCNAQTNLEEVKGASKIVINSIGVKTPKSEYEVTDTLLVNGILRELKKISPFVPDSGRSNFPTKSNFGFFEVKVFEDEKIKAIFKVVYTSYYGVIISMDNKYYKNDRLEYSILAAIPDE
jgi:hypothetical protein